MKLILKSNGKINNAKIEKGKNEISSIKIGFETSDIWSDIEIWLEDDKGNYLDYIALNVTKRNKLKSHKF